MKIGQVSKKTDLSVQTIRYYETQNLIKSAGRTDGNFRVYDSKVIEQLEFIKHCRHLDLSLSDIKRINELRDNPNAVCEEVNELINDQVKMVKIKMKELRHLKTQLEALTDSCSNNQKVGDCGIIKSLQECDC
ncbi:Cd(II)/Pb(II)-responsive transcriptional regulator [Marinicella sp. S1101]|uniref:Cd(II)/Pb(II)-responsive transcriptional regulator n=1 Tax=Marinicella marina TaxID=2996016 RepID=UPI002260B1A3|nr:Cd(II)/Pb(II)-responsive transcriptional regulator [Marinicella marina]MCX7554213.1 Cd(II)/Pb(II)-responsive transcriptional regulator [Marinicella marina]MDJ1141094.1 Cd(II)/Pb(II)-responsive transcriptional regulator [Marinicella marina]